MCCLKQSQTSTKAGQLVNRPRFHAARLPCLTGGTQPGHVNQAATFFLKPCAANTHLGKLPFRSKLLAFVHCMHPNVQLSRSTHHNQFANHVSDEGLLKHLLDAGTASTSTHQSRSGQQSTFGPPAELGSLGSVVRKLCLLVCFHVEHLLRHATSCAKMERETDM